MPRVCRCFSNIGSQRNRCERVEIRRETANVPHLFEDCTHLEVTLTALLTGNFAPEAIEPPDIFRIPYWRSIRLRQEANFDPQRAQRVLKEALQESPPPSMTAFRKRTGYRDWTINKHSPELCKNLCERSRQHRALAVKKRLDDKICALKHNLALG